MIGILDSMLTLIISDPSPTCTASPLASLSPRDIHPSTLTLDTFDRLVHTGEDVGLTRQELAPLITRRRVVQARDSLKEALQMTLFHVTEALSEEDGEYRRVLQVPTGNVARIYDACGRKK